MIYSIGYAGLTPAELLATAKQLDATVIDVRFVPKSRMKGFGRLQIMALLGDRYLWKGDVLGGIHGENKGPTSAGLKWLTDNAWAMTTEVTSRPNALLMCLEESPGECHRHSLIAVPLLKRGIDVLHIFRDELVTTSELKRSLAAGDDDQYKFRRLSLTG